MRKHRDDLLEPPPDYECCIGFPDCSGSCCIANETETLDPAVETAPDSNKLDDPSNTLDEPKKADRDPENVHGTAPPKRGICRRCGQDRPINRLMLCYRCWVITMLEDEAKSRGDRWSEGMPHPAWCGCTGLGEHQNGDGTSRGLN